MADTDLLTMGEAAQYLAGLKGPTKDPLLEVYVGAVSEAIDDICGPDVQREIVEIHNGGTALVLDHEPVGEIAISERTGLTTTAIAYSTLAVSGRFVDRPYLGFTAGVRAYTVTYTAGRFADTASVTSRFKLAAGLYLQAMWRSSEGGGSETFGGVPGLPVATPEEVLTILGGEVRAPVVA